MSLRVAEFARRGPSLGLILAAGLILRLLWLVYAQPVPFSDYAQYRELAVGLLDHGAFGHPEPHTFRLPAYPAFLALAMLVSRADLWLGAVNALASALACGLLFLLARRLGAGEGAARAAAGLAALNPAFVLYAPVLASENLFAPLMLLVLGWPWEAPGPGRPPAAEGSPGPWRPACSTGWPALTRGEALFYLPLVAAVLAWRGGGGCGGGLWPWRSSAWRRGSWPGPGACATWRWPERGRTSTSSGMTFYEGQSPSLRLRGDYANPPFAGLTWPQRQALAYRLAFAYLREHPGHVLDHALRGTLGLYQPSLMPVRAGVARPHDSTASGPWWAQAYAVAGYLALLVLAGLGFWRWRSWPRPALVMALAVIGLNWLGYACALLGHDRYRFLPEFSCAWRPASGWPPGQPGKPRAELIPAGLRPASDVLGRRQAGHAALAHGLGHLPGRAGEVAGGVDPGQIGALLWSVLTNWRLAGSSSTPRPLASSMAPLAPSSMKTPATARREPSSSSRPSTLSAPRMRLTRRPGWRMTALSPSRAARAGATVRHW